MCVCVGVLVALGVWGCAKEVEKMENLMGVTASMFSVQGASFPAPNAGEPTTDHCKSVEAHS